MSKVKFLLALNSKSISNYYIDLVYANVLLEGLTKFVLNWLIGLPQRVIFSLITKLLAVVLEDVLSTWQTPAHFRSNIPLCLEKPEYIQFYSMNSSWMFSMGWKQKYSCFKCKHVWHDTLNLFILLKLIMKLKLKLGERAIRFLSNVCVYK